MKGLTLLADTGYVEFPNIFKNHGIKLPVNEVAFKIGSFEIRWYGVLISLGVVLCISLALSQCKKYDIKSDDLLDYLIVCIPSAIVGARLYYVIFNFSLYKDDLKSIFAYWEGGLAVYGGVLAAVLACFITAKVKKQSFLKIIDFSIGYIALGQAIGRWGNFFNQEAFGGPTTLPWGMTGDKIASFVKSQGWQTGTLVHPTFFYESFWCLIVFTVIMLYRRSKLKKMDGECLCLYMILYGAERMIVEGLRTDSLYIGGTGIRVSQLLSAILIILGITLFIDFRRKWNTKVYEGETEDEKQESGLASVIDRIDAAEEDSAEEAPVSEESTEETVPTEENTADETSGS